MLQVRATVRQSGNTPRQDEGELIVQHDIGVLWFEKMGYADATRTEIRAVDSGLRGVDGDRDAPSGITW
jgi:hypothetical protein